MVTSVKAVIRIQIRYFYASDCSRWENLERLNIIGLNQQQLLDEYRKLKAVTPELSGMTATNIEGDETYKAI